MPRPSKLIRMAALAAGLLLILSLTLAACGEDDAGDAESGRGGSSEGIVVTDVWSRSAILLDGDDDHHDEHHATQDDHHDEHHDEDDAEHHDEHDEHDHGGGTNGVVYLRIENRGDEPDRLTGARSEVAQTVELHTTNMADGVMQMRQVEGGIEIPPGETVAFEQGGYHVMLIGLQQALKEGDRFEVELTFERAGTITVESEVRSE